jgi:hypothetical protein
MHATEVPIATPCGADWRTMKPTDNKRFCDSCKKHVHDLSAMTSAEARAVLASPPVEGLCVRYLHDAHGDIVFQQAPIAPTLLVRAKRMARVAAIAALPMAMAACAAGATTGSPPPVMGAVACPVPSASASAIAPEVLVPMMGAPPAMVPQTAPSASAP